MTADADDPELPQLPELASARAWIAGRRDFFDAGRPVLVARAPGRLDVMGGIADYSGSLVLEFPLALATWVAVQAQEAPTLVIETSASGDGRVVVPLGDLAPDPPLTYEAARARLTADPRGAWAAYVAGVVVVLQRERGVRLQQGARILVRSDVPVGKGISSSAALEVAALAALAALVGAEIDGRDLALCAQIVENAVVGAPCGVMDQMTAACGQRDQLLALLCQPATIVENAPIPAGLELFGIDSDIRHAVTGADYATVRAAAFMGYRMIADLVGLPTTEVARGRVVIDDPQFRGYLANIPPADWRARFRALVPEHMIGRDFLSRYGGATDIATVVDPDRRYPVRAATEHPIEENQRVHEYWTRLHTGAADEASRARLGELMYQSHASYSACGLGSDGTDRLVALCRSAGPPGVYGAKITGGGSGGTVAVLAAAGKRATVDAIARRYAEETGRAAAVFAGSSSGAQAFGVHTIRAD